MTEKKLQPAVSLNKHFIKEFDAQNGVKQNYGKTRYRADILDSLGKIHSSLIFKVKTT